MLDQERTLDLIQNEEQEKSVNYVYKKLTIMRIITIIKIMQKVLSEVPQFRSEGICPVIMQSLGGEKNNRHSILRVYCNDSIQFTQIAQSVLNITIVEHFQFRMLMAGSLGKVIEFQSKRAQVFRVQVMKLFASIIAVAAGARRRCCRGRHCCLLFS
jgi:hypothetical protein